MFNDYILTAPYESQRPLIEIFQIIDEELPDAEKRIYRGVPSYFCGEHNLLNIKAYNTHFAFHIGGDGVSILRKIHPEYRYTRSAIVIPYYKPFPYDVLKSICKMINSGIKSL